MRKYCVLCQKQDKLDNSGVCRPCRNIYEFARDGSETNIINDMDLTESERRIVQAITSNMNAWKTELLQEIKQRDEKIEVLTEELTILKSSVSKLEEQIENNEAYERRDCLVFSGSSVPPCETGENPISLMCGVLKNKLKLEFPESAVSTGHRLGAKPRTQGEDRRAIIMKFCRRETKMEILNACKQVKPQNLYANESLTPTRSKIMYILRQAKKSHSSKISACKSIEGRVAVWVKPPRPNAPGARDTRIFVNTRVQLEKFLSDFLELRVNDFYSGEWPN